MLKKHIKSWILLKEGRLAQESSNWWLLVWQQSASENEKITFAKKYCMIICKAIAILPTQKAHVIILNYTQQSIFYRIFTSFFFLQLMHWFLSRVHYMPPFVNSQIPVLCTCKISSSWHFSHQCQSLQKWSFKGSHVRYYSFWMGSIFNAP